MVFFDGGKIMKIIKKEGIIMKKRFVLIWILFLFSTFAVVPSELFAAKKAPDTIKISAVLSSTGPFAPLATQAKNAYQIYFEKVNAEGGIFVKEFNKKIPVEIKILDDESDGLKTILQLEVANEWGAVANLGGIGCTSFEVGTVVAQKNKMVWLGPGCAGWTPHQRGINYMFSTFFKTPFISPLVYDMVMSMPEPRPKKVAIFEINQLDCEEAVEYWRKGAEKKGFEIVYHQKYALGTKDFSAMITGAKAAGAEILLGYPAPPEGPAMIKQMKELDYNPKLIYWIRAPEASSFGPALGPLADYVCVPVAWSNQLAISGNDQLNAQHQKVHGKLGDPITGSAYAAGQVLVDAIKRAGTLDRKAIRDAIAKTDMETVAGRIRFSPQGWAVDRLVLVLQWKDGKQNIVYYNETGQNYKKNIPKVDLKWQPPWSSR